MTAPTIPTTFFQIAERMPEALVYKQAVAEAGDTSSDVPRRWRSVNFRTVEQHVNALAGALQRAGVTQGTKVAIVSQTRPEWMEADLAILALGAISVSVYQSLPADDIAYILFDSGADVVFAENQEQFDKLIELTSRAIRMPATEERPESLTQVVLRKILTFEPVAPHPLAESYDQIVSNTTAPRPNQYETVAVDELAALVYTSGTTGPPKGVMQSHRNHLANVRQAFECGLVDNSSSICLFLPLAHAFAKLMGYIGFLTPVVVHFPGIIDRTSSGLNPASTTKDIRESDAQIFPVVPRLLEKMRDGVLAARNTPGLKGKLVRLTLWSANQVFEAQKNGRSASVGARLAFAATGSLRKKLQRRLFGNSFHFVVSGGAKLPLEVAEFFTSLGIPILEGYGLTETCVATNIARMGKTPLGSVGPVLAPDIELRIEEDGEILFRGPNIALGYYHRDAATKAAWTEDGWFRTGDLGTRDDDGNLRIVGRKKEILVTSGGKNIAPNDIEEQLKRSPLVSQAVLVGDGRKYCVALLTLNKDELEHWAKKEQLVLEGPANGNPKLREAISAHIQAMNASLASFETVKKFYLLDEEFTVENGMLTPTFKVKRPVVEKRYAAQIDSLY
ncbi:MAG: AMP-binding protein [Bdellovibrionales bacterium]|nr:AMP-binding protein [Bdellovibrionales bacterium]